MKEVAQADAIITELHTAAEYGAAEDEEVVQAAGRMLEAAQKKLAVTQQAQEMAQVAALSAPGHS